MTEFADIQVKLDRFLGDGLPAEEGQERTFPLPLRVDAWNWAQKYFANHTPREREAVLEIGEGGRQASLPDDFLAVRGVYDQQEGHWWYELPIRAGDFRPADSDAPEYWIWSSSMHLERDVGSEDLTLYYWAYYPEIEFIVGEDNEDITYEQGDVYTPHWAELPLCYLTTAIAWHPGIVLASDINQWRIKVDSGTPMHNPREAAAREALWWYNRLLSEIQPAMR